MNKYNAIIYDIDGTILNTLNMNMYPLLQIIKEETGETWSFDQVLKFAAWGRFFSWRYGTGIIYLYFWKSEKDTYICKTILNDTDCIYHNGTCSLCGESLDDYSWYSILKYELRNYASNTKRNRRSKCSFHIKKYSAQFI